MATIITSDCINCGACEPECPNTAIYAGGVEWELGGETHPPLAQDIFYIVPSKCTECVGFYDHEACAAVCPVDCCVTDPNNIETEQVLLERARMLHPDRTFGDDAPSRFRKDGAPAPAAANGPAAGNGLAAAEAASAPAAAPAPAAPKPAAAAPKPAAAPAPKPAPAAAILNLPKDVGALPGPIGEKHFSGELEEDFDTVLGWVDLKPVQSAPVPVQIAMRLGEPVLGAMPDKIKADLEEAVGNPLAFSRARATALNLILNLIVYPIITTAFAVLVLGDDLFSLATRGWILLGVLLAVIEAVWRLREGILHAKPASELIYRAAIWGLLLAPLGALLVRGSRFSRVKRTVGFDGYTSDLYDEKIERDRRYGSVYTIDEHSNAYLVRLEMPRRVPASSLKRLWNLPDEMPDYDYNISLSDGVLTISASVRGEAMRRLSYISSSFPADFTTRIDFDEPVTTFKHRLRNKVIEIIVLKSRNEEISRAA
jgi:ferredoxin/HSP20 family molecular chaperone IbpA